MRPLKSIHDIQWHQVWNTAGTGLAERVKEFWATQYAIADAEAREKRVRELIMVAMDKDRNIIATSTGVKTKINRLNGNWFYEYRCFIAQPYRTMGFDCHLTVESFHTLEGLAQSDQDKPIGTFVVVQNKNLNYYKVSGATVWRPYKMYFMGFNSDGFPIRVYYFPGATI